MTKTADSGSSKRASTAKNVVSGDVETLDTVVNNRRTVKASDRRDGIDRRKKQVPVAIDRRKQDRRQLERRRQIDPTTCERDYDPDEMEFMREIEQYKKVFHRPFPTWSEVLEVIKSLGYRKVAEKSVIIQNRAKANVPSSSEF